MREEVLCAPALPACCSTHKQAAVCKILQIRTIQETNRKPRPRPQTVQSAATIKKAPRHSLRRTGKLRARQSQHSVSTAGGVARSPLPVLAAQHHTGTFASLVTRPLFHALLPQHRCWVGSGHAAPQMGTTAPQSGAGCARTALVGSTSLAHGCSPHNLSRAKTGAVNRGLSCARTDST